MKNKFLFLCLLVGLLSSCQEKGDVLSVTLSMPNTYSPSMDIAPSVSVWCDNIDNVEFVFSKVDTEGHLVYCSKQAYTSGLVGMTRVLSPYDAAATYDGTKVTLHQQAVQAPHTQIIYTGGATAEAGQTLVVSMRQMTARVLITMENAPKDDEVVSITLRVSPKEGYTANLFYQEATYEYATSQMKTNGQAQRSSFTTYGSDTLCLGVLADNYANCDIRAEVITSSGKLHVFVLEGKAMSRTQSYLYTIDFATSHETGVAYTADSEGLVSLGLPITIDGVTYAPVNLGYDELKAPFGLLYSGSDFTGFPYYEVSPIDAICNDQLGETLSALPEGWRLPTEGEIEKLLSTGHSAGAIAGSTFGWWLGEKLYLEATGKMAADGSCSGRLVEGYYWIDGGEEALYLSDERCEIVNAPTLRCAIRLVR